MCGFGNGNESGIIWIILLLCLCGGNHNNGCVGGIGDNNWNSWIWILILLCCCGSGSNQIGGCTSC